MIYTITFNPALDYELTVMNIEMNCVLRSQSTKVDWDGKSPNVSSTLLAFGAENTALGIIGERLDTEQQRQAWMA